MTLCGVVAIIAGGHTAQCTRNVKFNTCEGDKMDPAVLNFTGRTDH